MIRIGLPCALLTTLALALPAHAALLTRTFVSSAGSDTNPCTIAQPCGTFAHAYTLTAANGIIAALDPGKYGALTISHAITINGNGWSAITAPAGDNGITINAGVNDAVTINGVEIDGAGAGFNGIFFTSGFSLTVTNCTVQNFLRSGISSFDTGAGIFMGPTSGSSSYTITNVTASNNGYGGIVYNPQSGTQNAFGVLDHVAANANAFGIVVNTNNTAGGTVTMTIAGSIASNNGGPGIQATGSNVNVTIDSATLSNNLDGVAANGTAKVYLGRSVLANNNAGVSNSTAPNTFFTFQNNEFDLNGTDVDTSMNTISVK